MKTLLLLLLLLGAPLLTSAQSACPSDLETDPAPGQCGLYVDTNANANCDLSASEQETKSPSTPASQPHQCTETKIEPGSGDLISGADLKTKTVAQIAELYGIDTMAYAKALSARYKVEVTGDTKMLLLHDNYGMESKVAKTMALELQAGQIANQVSATSSAEPIKKARYQLVPSSIILIGAYLLGLVLVKRKIISLLMHRRFWNLLLLVSFLGSAILGLLLVIRINFGWNLPLPFNMLYWHVETGIVMAIISIFHTLWHWKYFQAMLVKKVSTNTTNSKQGS